MGFIGLMWVEVLIGFGVKVYSLFRPRHPATPTKPIPAPAAAAAAFKRRASWWGGGAGGGGGGRGERGGRERIGERGRERGRLQGFGGLGGF